MTRKIKRRVQSETAPLLRKLAEQRFPAPNGGVGYVQLGEAMGKILGKPVERGSVYQTIATAPTRPGRNSERWNALLQCLEITEAELFAQQAARPAKPVAPKPVAAKPPVNDLLSDLAKIGALLDGEQVADEWLAKAKRWEAALRAAKQVTCGGEGIGTRLG